LLINPGHLDLVDLATDDFYIDRHKLIYSTLRGIHGSGSTPDYVTVVETLERQDKLRTVGEAYITELIAEAGLSSYLDGYIRIISDYSLRRRILANASRLAGIATDLESKVNGNLADVVDDLAMGSKPRHGAEIWTSHLSKYYDWVQERDLHPGDIWGIPTGFKDFDRITGGVQSGDLIYIAGKPGIGKSIMSMQAAVNMARAGIPGGIYSLEMSAHQVIGRIISGMARVSSYAIKSGRITESDWPTITAAIDEAYKWPLYISDDATITTANLRADLARLKARYGIKWCVVDYDMLLQDGGGKLDENTFANVVSSRMKAIARDLELAVITISSVTKDQVGEDDNSPSLKSLRGTAQKLHNADIAGVLTAHIPDAKKWEKPNANLLTFTFVKGRELEHLGSFHLVKFEKFPLLGDYAA
jgi:replicative DNA helicase